MNKRPRCGRKRSGASALSVVSLPAFGRAILYCKSRLNNPSH
nr:MAG TPA: hypothetical protein [Caudoviricetes sp.]